MLIFWISSNERNDNINRSYQETNSMLMLFAI